MKKLFYFIKFNRYAWIYIFSYIFVLLSVCMLTRTFQSFSHIGVILINCLIPIGCWCFYRAIIILHNFKENYNLFISLCNLYDSTFDGKNYKIKKSILYKMQTPCEKIIRNELVKKYKVQL